VSVEIEIVDDPARACAALLVGAAAGGGHVVLTGGSTPRAAYEEFSEAVRAVDVSLDATHFWFGDERCVPPEDDRSNFRLARESIFDPLNDRGATVHRMAGEAGPIEGASAYASELGEAGEPVFDLLLLGLGPDGHCASLFPGQETVSIRDRLVVGVPEAGLEPFVPRISFTMTAIARARQVVFLISGAGKADAVARAFGPSAEPSVEVPSSIVPTVAEQVTVLLDPDAASKL
jgi:6-phosphogluconolactonase